MIFPLASSAPARAPHPQVGASGAGGRARAGLGRGRALTATGAVIAAIALLAVAAQPAAAQGGDVTRGARVYDANCAVCHGSEGQGRVGVKLTQDFPAIDLTAFVRQAVVAGVPGTRMPAWSQAHGGPLSEQEINDVTAFVESLGSGRSPAAPTATPFPVTPAPTALGATGDAGRGKALYVGNCAVCHGDQGQGRMGATLSTVFSAINPQAYTRAAVAQGVPGTMMPAWGAEYGGPLTNADLDDLSAYVISLSGRSEPATTAQPAAGRRGRLAVGLVFLALLVIGPALLIASDRRPSPPAGDSS